jgi:DNA-binding transcriptional ArsR family regulator
MSDRNESGPRLPDAVIEAIGELMGTLADPTRIAILELLRGGELNGLRMADELGVPHKNVSHHLAILTRAGVLARRREGRHVFYVIEDWTALWLIEQAARALSNPDA